MTDFAQTTTNHVGSIVGMGEATYWGIAVWTVDVWGSSVDMATDVNVGPTMAPINFASTIGGHSVVKAPIDNSLAVSDAYGKSFVKAPISSTMVFTENLESIKKSIGVWDYIFTLPTVDGDEQVFDQFTKTTDPSDAFTAVADGSTTWTGV